MVMLKKTEQQKTKNKSASHILDFSGLLIAAASALIQDNEQL